MNRGPGLATPYGAGRGQPVHLFARQPILDKSLELYGYELLYRDESSEACGPVAATARLVDGLLTRSIAALANGRRAFVNVSEHFLLGGLVELIPPASIVIEIVETVRPTPAVLRRLRSLKRKGYSIALDDFCFTAEKAPLVELADIIKVDFLATLGDERRAVMELCGKGLLYLAEKVETRADFEHAAELGYDLFQGFFFFEPELIRRAALPRREQSCLELLREVNSHAPDLERVEAVVRLETSLSTDLLRHVHSGAVDAAGAVAPIDSIRHALVRMGSEPLRRWALLTAMSTLSGDGPLELVRICLARARFCERIGARACLATSEVDLFLTGLFSAVDALTGVPIEEALKPLGLDPAIPSALRGEDSGLGRAYALARACERGDASALRQLTAALGLSPMDASQVWLDALQWADETSTSIEPG